VGRADDLRDLVAGEILELTQHEDGLEVRREGRETGLDLARALALLHRVGGLLASRVHDLRLAILVVDERRRRELRPALAQVVDREIRDDAIEPRRELVREIEALEAAEYPQKSLLREVLGVLVGRDHVARDPDGARFVTAHESLERLFLATLGARDELVVARPVHLERRELGDLPRQVELEVRIGVFLFVLHLGRSRSGDVGKRREELLRAPRVRRSGLARIARRMSAGEHEWSPGTAVAINAIPVP
jgi:hypothetical protein